MIVSALEAVLARPDVWRGAAAHWAETLPSGLAALDAALGGGWPLGVLGDCLVQCEAGGMALFLPALARLTREHWAVLISPPHVPYAPALAQAGVDLSRLLVLRPPSDERLWAALQCLESGACSAVFLWGGDGGLRDFRRLQLAAEESRVLAVLFHVRDEHRPAALRLAVRPRPEGGLVVELLKCRGRPARRIELPDAV
ncbi:MAG TPA: translesion DNA synthesis-associated protein ImuA [Gammaproteobacteria bacterium]|nr:translesion DNA synthesis-associated protein ImuA [Gammaproteobacteria bacterium]